MDDDVVASFGIDDEELTFGSSTTCGVRLYYPDVDSLHCKIVFDQYKVCSLLIILYPNKSIEYDFRRSSPSWACRVPSWTDVRCFHIRQAKVLVLRSKPLSR